MGLESASYISQLVATNPVGGVDNYSTADDHLRLIKAVLQGQFPNFTAAAMNASVAELNLLVGLTAAAAELNVLDGFTGNVSDLNILSGQAGAGLTGVELGYVNGVTSALQTQLDGKAASGHGHATADITSGTFADARIAVTNVTQWQASINHDALLNFVAAEHIDWSVTGAEDVHIDRIPVTSINHDALTNFAADEHVAHSSVTLTAGVGLSGGGTIAANRTFNLDTTNMTAEAVEASDADADLVAVYDASAAAMRKAPLGNFVSPEIVTEAGASLTLDSTHHAKLIRCSNAGVCTITLPTAGIHAGFWCVVQETNATGSVTLATAGTLQTVSNLTDILDQFGAITLLYLGSSTWTAWGNLG